MRAPVLRRMTSVSLSMHIKDALSEIGAALKRPEQLAIRWRDRAQYPEDTPTRAVFAVFLINAIIGLAIYGLTMGMHRGTEAMLLSALKTPLACGIAWTVTLPGLYVLNSATGSKLDASTTTLVALTTVSFGALAMLASVPVNWFFSLALPYKFTRILVNLLIFGGVGVCMSDVFLRTIRAAEPGRSVTIAFGWLVLLCAIGMQLHLLLGIFDV